MLIGGYEAGLSHAGRVIGSCGLCFGRCFPRLFPVPYFSVGTSRYRVFSHVFSHDFRRPYWSPKTMKRRPCWCPKPILWELNSFPMQTLSFIPINLQRCWPREWKHSMALLTVNGGGHLDFQMYWGGRGLGIIALGEGGEKNKGTVPTSLRLRSVSALYQQRRHLIGY